jgi:TolA-binding protein
VPTGSAERATLPAVSAWSWSLVALGLAGLALLLAIGSWAFCASAIRGERERRSQRVNEAVFQWAGSAASKAEIEELRQSVAELSDIKETMTNSDLRQAVAQLDERLTSLEAEEQARAETRFRRLPRR